MEGKQVRALWFWLALVGVGAVLCVPHLLIAQSSKSSASNKTEQSDFGIELEAEPIQRPVDLPRAALDALSNALSEDNRDAHCLERNGSSDGQLHSNWFAASEIHLDGPDEVDLVVLPDSRNPDTPKGSIPPIMCLIGANTAHMWVLRKTKTGFQVVLSEIGLGMNVLSTRTRGLRDIRVGAAVGGYDDEIEYKFDGKSYQIARRKSELIGAELPGSLSGYETRKSLIQLPDQTAESVRAQARAWIWQEWWQRRSYLKIKTRDDEADETASYYIAPDTKGEWQIIIKTHRVLRATPTQGSITEDKLSIATDIQRIEAPAGGSNRQRVIPDTENVPESKYRLQFLDYGERIIGTL
jgi:hypothetical protein